MILSLRKPLESAGLKKKEITVLEALIESGSPMLVSSLARATKLNRTTIYDIVRELSEKALVSRVEKDGVTRYQAIAVELLPSWIERQREELAESKRHIAEMIPQIKLLRTRGKSLPKVQFFEGEEGVTQAYDDVAENNKEKLLRGITGMDAVYENLDNKWVTAFLEKRTRLGIRCIDIVPETESGRRSKADDHKYIRTTKFLPAKYTFDGDISIYDNKVAVVSYARENPIAVIIEDEAISDMMKTLFDFIAEKAA
ncbi:hypothetical protein A3A39_01195 [Candidatus Kaiserbacteria bacterium RIFCSPLOWO2_01_FULL_54_13]|uniref:Transcription regulator TrmB N-terminal domain-containing protein n=1 Tax=Candidatus Kaiserbacteria bacterium RIFCSPLOWO2_01_FULL_54_13 TaxID=1798512 RepID=A0A1F6F2C3_9BACT|nr:MAG: hypothetical protein A3A39_01195 [Candidatus Kaiserbacteria bacterium RIFCSPLOWO2_01_FULL_54_13]